MAAPDDPGDTTIASYEQAAARYRAQRGDPAPEHVAFLDRFAELVRAAPGAGTVLEIGSGPGIEADLIEARGLRVRRTDATRAFVELLRAAGHEATVLDARTDDLGGPYAGVLADAVLLHLTRPQFADLLLRARAAVPGGALALTLKEGDGAAWSTAKLDVPRWFTYWREPALRAALTQAGWTVVELARVQGRLEPWLYVLAAAG